MNRKPLSAPTRAFRTGEVIFREGDPPADEAFMIHIGRVEVRKQVGAEERLLRVLVKGELLGELGLFGNSPRSATAVAAEPVTLVVIPARQLNHLVRTNPALAVAIIRDLSTKLLATNELLAAEGRRRQADDLLGTGRSSLRSSAGLAGATRSGGGSEGAPT